MKRYNVPCGVMVAVVAVLSRNNNNRQPPCACVRVGMAAHCITQIFQKDLQILELDRLALISKRDAPSHKSNACGGWHCNTQQ